MPKKKKNRCVVVQIWTRCIFLFWLSLLPSGFCRVQHTSKRFPPSLPPRKCGKNSAVHPVVKRVWCGGREEEESGERVAKVEKKRRTMLGKNGAKPSSFFFFFICYFLIENFWPKRLSFFFQIWL